VDVATCHASDVRSSIVGGLLCLSEVQRGDVVVSVLGSVDLRSLVTDFGGAARLGARREREGHTKPGVVTDREGLHKGTGVVSPTTVPRD
jgi:hypothetical protein